MTAVEYIREKLLGDEYWYEGMTFDQIIEQALAMEKEQIMDAWDNGWHEHMNPPSTYITSVKYYNETFKSE